MNKNIPLVFVAAGILITFLVVALVLCTVFRAPSSLNVDAGSPGDTLVLKNFFEPEKSDTTTFRWSSNNAHLMLYGAGSGPLQLALRVQGHHLAHAHGQFFLLSQHNEPFARVGVDDPGWRVYHILMPETLVNQATLTAPPQVTLAPSSYHVGEHDNRYLGLPLDQVVITPLWQAGILPHNWGLPLAAAALLAWLLLALATVLWYATPTPSCQTRLLLLSLVVGLAAAALIVWALRSPATLMWFLSAQWGLLTLATIIILVPLWQRLWAWFKQPSHVADEHATPTAPRAASMRLLYGGLGLVSLAILMYQSLLTRIFSVTMWYHFAFMAVSITMFGMTLGAMLVYLFPSRFSPEKTGHHLALSALLFAVSIVASFLIYLETPVLMQAIFPTTDIPSLVVTYIIMTIPFLFGGIAVTLALTRFPHHVGKLYAADLVGAALGCLLLVGALNVTDGPTAVFLVALGASAGALAFAGWQHLRRLQHLALLCCVLLASFAVANTALINHHVPLLRLKWVKGKLEAPPFYEDWNSFSRVTVLGDPRTTGLTSPFGWGLSAAYNSEQEVKELYLQIDAGAGTVITAFDGDVSEVKHLKYDVTNIVHYLRPDSRVLIVGAGGGRDILSALVFDQQAVVGVEMNEAIVKLVTERLASFTGHLNDYPRVTIVNDEARSYITRQERESFDIIQIPLVDTWAATAAGGFVLSENSLYTLEAWEIFLRRLKPGGVLSVSHLYFPQGPGEIYRFVSLATAALDRFGVANPGNHIIVAGRIRSPHEESEEDAPPGIGTVLISKEPFSDTDLDRLEEVCARMQFDITYSSRQASDPIFEQIIASGGQGTFITSFPINIAPPTDNSPFFFHMARTQNVLNSAFQAQSPRSFGLSAVYTLVVLLIVVTLLTLFFIIVPLFFTTNREILRGSLPQLLFFASIGCGFMLIEISQMQRLAIFLGQPTYSLLVVLSTLLVASGIGSYSTRTIADSRLRPAGMMRLSLLLAVVLVFGLLTPFITSAFQSSMTIIRIAIAILILFPLGMSMGVAFPLGMRTASITDARLTPWLWGVNGATSVFSSVLAVVIALNWGIASAFWAGFGCYIVALLAYGWGHRATSEGRLAFWHMQRRGA